MSLGEILKGVLGLRSDMRTAGATNSAILEATERSIRSAWPFTREWKYLCQRCLDHGLEMFQCPGDATCGRSKPHHAHDYGQPCWCSAGAKFKAKPKTDADFQQAGKVTKAKSFSRIGQ